MSEADRKQLLDRIEKSLKKLSGILYTLFTDDNSTVVTNYSQIRSIIYDLSTSKPTTSDKVKVNKFIRENIQQFIYFYIEPKLTPIDKVTKDPHSFVTTLNQLWSHFQIFIFSFYHVSEKFFQFFQGFYKFPHCKDHLYQTRLSKGKQQVVSVATMGVNELKKYFEKIRLIQKFKVVFNQFLQFQRQGKSVPRVEIRQSIHSLESCYFDMDAALKLNTDKKPMIYKKIDKMEKFSLNRRSKDTQFFNDHILHDTISGLVRYYTDFVNERAVNMGTTDEIEKIISTIEQEETRAQYYIHTLKNREEYIQNMNKCLVEFKIENRLRKNDGFKRYIELFEDKKEDYSKQIDHLWKVYSRVPEKSVKILKEIFSEFLLAEAEKVSQKTKKPPEFIEELIRINSKCFKIVEFCGKHFELENERNNKIRGMLSNDLTERGRRQAKFDIGAKNLASYINHKFKINYTKGGLQSLGQLYKELVNLFKILQEKVRFIDQHSKHMANRLLEDVEFSKDLEVGQIIALEKNFIEEIQKECGVSQVKQLVENIKDIQKSIDINNKLKSHIKEQIRYPLNQIIIKNANYWPERSAYNVENPPRILLRSYNSLLEYFKRQNTNIFFEFNTGISIFQGQFDTGKKQRFQFKNLHLLILLFIDEQQKLLYGHLKKKIESTGINKQKGVIQLARAVIELLYSGLLISSTKSIKPGTPNICKISQTDEFEVNRNYDFVAEEKRKKGSKGPPPKPIPVVKGNILILSEQIKRGFDEEIRSLNDDEKRIQAERKFIIECAMVKSLKHAHHHHMNCTFEQLYKVTQEGRNKEFRVNEKFLKQIIEDLINKELCERVEGQRNLFRYIA